MPSRRPQRNLHWFLAICCCLGVFAKATYAQQNSTKAKTVAPVAVDPTWIPQRLLPLLHAPEVHVELNLSEKQVQQLEKLFLTTDGPWWRSRNLPRAGQVAETAKIEAWMNEQLASLFDANQRRRLTQLERQAQGARMLLRPEVATELKLSRDQTAKLLDLFESTEKAISAGGKAVDEREDALKLLTSEQKTGLVPLVGKSFELSQLKRIYPLAPEIEGIEAWINSNGGKLSDLRGKVVAVHFYAFACSNCQANIPIYNELFSEFKNSDFAMIGIQTPELNSERDFQQVKQAATKSQMVYPIAMDANAVSWKAWGNTMWPTIYLIDKQGYIRFWWPGELRWQGATGDEQVRETIQALLKE